MANTNATILIPDISGFTEFMTNTEKGHGSFVIKYLLELSHGALSYRAGGCGIVISRH